MININSTKYSIHGNNCGNKIARHFMYFVSMSRKNKVKINDNDAT